MMYEITSTASAPLNAFLYVSPFFVRSPTDILSRKHSPTRDNSAGYTNGDFCRLSVALLTDLATEGRCWRASDRSEGAIVDGAIVEAIDIERLMSATVVEAMLAVRVCVAGELLAPAGGNPLPGNS
jgi:hypothetical protein